MWVNLPLEIEIEFRDCAGNPWEAQAEGYREKHLQEAAEYREIHRTRVNHRNREHMRERRARKAPRIEEPRSPAAFQGPCWARPVRARKAHYFGRGQGRSACGKWAFGGRMFFGAPVSNFSSRCAVCEERSE